MSKEAWKQIKDIRKIMGIKQGELVRNLEKYSRGRIKLSQNTWSCYENGSRAPENEKTIFSYLAAMWNLNPDYFMAKDFNDLYPGKSEAIKRMISQGAYQSALKITLDNIEKSNERELKRLSSYSKKEFNFKDPAKNSFLKIMEVIDVLNNISVKQEENSELDPARLGRFSWEPLKQLCFSLVELSYSYKDCTSDHPLEFQTGKFSTILKLKKRLIVKIEHIQDFDFSYTVKGKKYRIEYDAGSYLVNNRSTQAKTILSDFYDRINRELGEISTVLESERILTWFPLLLVLSIKDHGFEREIKKEDGLTIYTHSRGKLKLVNHGNVTEMFFDNKPISFKEFFKRL